MGPGREWGMGRTVAVGVGVPGCNLSFPVETFQLEGQLLGPELP